MTLVAGKKFANNISVNLVSTFLVSDTDVGSKLSAQDLSSLLALISIGETMTATFQGASNVEIISIFTPDNIQLLSTRAIESTVAIQWPVSSVLEVRITADFLNKLVSVVETLEANSGGGGAAFGINPGSFSQLDAFTSSVTWDVSTNGPLVVRADNLASATINISSSILPTGTEVLSNKLIVMAGDDGAASALTINLNVDGVLSAGNVRFLYIDEIASAGVYDVGKSLNLLNQVAVFDILFHVQPADILQTDSGTLICTRLGQQTVPVANL